MEAISSRLLLEKYLWYWIAVQGYPYGNGRKNLTMNISLFTSCTQGMMEYVRTTFKMLDSIGFPGWFAMFLLMFFASYCNAALQS